MSPFAPDALAGRLAVVTGAGKGIGAAIARSLDAAGAALLLLDRDVDAARAVAADLADARAVCVDVADYEQVRSALEDVERIDVLVNNAGWDRVEPFLDNDPALWDTLIGINLRGPINLCHLALPRMGAGGRIVNVASDAGRVGSSGEAVYSACKGGVIALTKSLARESARSGVSVNCVCPGPTDTPLLAEIKGPQGMGRTMDAIVKATPLRKLAAPEDVAAAVTFLAAGPDHITGQTLSVSGGLTMAG
ncbi:MAG TPA: SDR family oxidoreductase [Solirubrobacteraceae bacterium]|jgi:2-hydroxycyclohexanecarboxyl-CoA dehydrogenase|nr:SDR family oxidoreductase [Solirubrobacteraceae bacterium]